VLAERLRDELTGAEIRLVRGPYAPAGRPPAGITLLDAPSELIGALADADLVVSGAGQTMLEALAVGTPCVAFVTADNQAESAAVLEAAGAVVVGRSADRVVELAAGIAHDFERRARQARVGRELVDGGGAARVASAILDRLGSPGTDGPATRPHASPLA
jgi:UDP-2,4-diacetamido-2,4,6-trideoxy-beta-L-altropyranose hydrolase